MPAGLYDDRTVIKDSLKLTHLASLLVIVATAAVTQWLAFGEQASSPLRRVQEGDVVRAGYALEPPFALLDAEGKVSGEAPEVFRRVLARLGPGRIEWVHAEFGSLQHELAAGRIDVIVSGLFITPERARHMLFSRPTARVCPAFAVVAGNPLALHGHADLLRHPAARLGVIAGAVEHDEARLTGVPLERLVAFPDPWSALAALRSGRIDAFALSSVSLRHALANTGGLEVISPLVAEPAPLPGRPAFAFRPQDGDLRDAVDEVLGSWLGSREHIDLVARFGFTAAELPGGAQGDARCFR